MSFNFPTISEPAPAPIVTEAASPSLASLFDEVSLRYPDRVAVCLGEEQLTYAELHRRAQHVAHVLAAQGVRAGGIVAVYLPRSIDMVSGMLGIIKAGATYLPIDPAYPPARVRETLADASPVLLMTDEILAAQLGAIEPPVMLLADVSAAGDSSASLPAVDADSVAYVIYTSGSTGRPKGVMVTHRNVTRLLTETQPWFHFSEGDVWTMFHSFAFDFSVWEMWGCLLTGGRLVIVPFEISRSPEDFMSLLSRERVTVLNQTPSAFSLLMQVPESIAKLPLALRYVIFGGEALNLRSLLPWITRHGDAAPQLINMYGITETTVHVTYRRILQADAERETDSLIGAPIPDLELHLLNADLQPVADGEVGELCIGGAGVSAGYLGRPELTAERFVAHPLGEAYGRLYRSGDLARRRADGELVYLGRADQQVKINGFRIELGEVEAALAASPHVAQVCVAAQPDHDGAQRLVAYFVANGAGTEPKLLSQFLAERLPAHMRPALYQRVESFPLTPNGKIDRKALPMPDSLQATALSQTPRACGTPEDRVAAIWKFVLQNNEIGMHDNFFDVGGTSLRLVAVRTALQAEFGVSIPVTWLFEHTTVSALADKLRANAGSTAQQPSAAQGKARQQRDAFARMRALRSMAS